MGLEHFDTVLSFAVLMLLLSLQITILVQVVVAISGLRGWNLSWSLTKLLEQIDPELKLKGYATKLSREILKHPTITYSRTLLGRRKATAIRPEELLRLLEDLATNPSSTLDDEIKKVVKKAFQSRVPGETPELVEKANEVVAELVTLFPAQTQIVEETVNRVLQKKKQVEVEIKAWFDTVMDRSTERFILNTRWITAVIAFALAFALHIDSIQIFKQLSTSSELRAKFVQQVDATLQQADAVMTQAQKPKPLTTDVIRSLRDDMKDKHDKERLAEVPTNLVTRQAGEDWLRNNFKEPKLTKLLAVYHNRFEEASMALLKELRDSLDVVKSSADQTRLQIIPLKFDWQYSTEKEWLLHLLGIVMSGLFLSLGAPFWFNALSQLANLRPVLAGKVEKEKPEEKK